MSRVAESVAIYGVIIGALAAGLAASYGRELEAHRQPDRAWFIRRMLIMPLLAIASTAAADAFALSASFAGFTAAMLSLSGYDALRLIESKWIKRLNGVSGTRLEPTERQSPEE